MTETAATGGADAAELFVARDLISRRTRRRFREALVGAYMGEIYDLFQDEVS